MGALSFTHECHAERDDNHGAGDMTRDGNGCDDESGEEILEKIDEKVDSMQINIRSDSTPKPIKSPLTPNSAIKGTIITYYTV